MLSRFPDDGGSSDDDVPESEDGKWWGSIHIGLVASAWHAGVEGRQNARVAVVAGRIDAVRTGLFVDGRGDPGMLVIFGIVPWKTWRSRHWHNLWILKGMALKSCWRSSHGHLF